MTIPVITRDELKALIDNKGAYTLIDVRERNELGYGMIPTAHNLPLSEIESAVALAPAAFAKKYGFALQKDARNIVHCRSGARSERAAVFLRSQGFTVENFKGSILSWSQIDPKVKAY